MKGRLSVLDSLEEVWGSTTCAVDSIRLFDLVITAIVHFCGLVTESSGREHRSSLLFFEYSSVSLSHLLQQINSKEAKVLAFCSTANINAFAKEILKH